MWRYNPETGRRQHVAEDSPEAVEWSSRKPSKTFVGLVSQGVGIGGTAGAQYVATRLATKAERKAATVVSRALKKGALVGVGGIAEATGISTGAAASSIIAAAITGWNLGKAIQYSVGNLDMRLDQALRNYVHAREEAARKLGRPLTKAELQKMYAAYKETVVRIKANEPDVYLRPGAG